MKAKYIPVVWVAIFAIAMGMLEAAVVIYLRELFYKGLPLFPLQPVPGNIAIVEISREIATIVMLAAIGYIAGKTARSRFACFLISFAVWDIFYYIFLKLFISWPETLLDWDILFLIPVPWFGPVLAPCLIATLMIVLGLLMIHHEEKNTRRFFTGTELSLFVSGCLVLLGSFMYDYYVQVISNGGLQVVVQALTREDYFGELPSFLPKKYHWELFIGGYSMLLVGVGMYHVRLRKLNMVLF